MPRTKTDAMGQLCLPIERSMSTKSDSGWSLSDQFPNLVFSHNFNKLANCTYLHKTSCPYTLAKSPLVFRCSVVYHTHWDSVIGTVQLGLLLRFAVLSSRIVAIVTGISLSRIKPRRVLQKQRLSYQSPVPTPCLLTHKKLIPASYLYL